MADILGHHTLQNDQSPTKIPEEPKNLRNPENQEFKIIHFSWYPDFLRDLLDFFNDSTRLLQMTEVLRKVIIYRC